jgi:hypothetical protein
VHPPSRQTQHSANCLGITIDSGFATRGLINTALPLLDAQGLTLRELHLSDALELHQRCSAKGGHVLHSINAPRGFQRSTI